MPKFTYAVYTNPTPGQEEEYNRWYDEQHLSDVLTLHGFISARRFRLRDTQAAGVPAQHYLALYEMETDDPESRLIELARSVPQVENSSAAMRYRSTMP